MNKAIIIILTALIVLFAGCSPDEFLRDMTNRMAPDNDVALAHQYLDALRSRDIDTAVKLLDPQLNKQGIESNLTILADLLDKGEAVSFELIGCNIQVTPGKRRSDLTYQYQFPNEWALASIVIGTENTNKYVSGIHVTPLQKSLKELNAFTFEGKGPGYYAVLLGAIIIPIFILTALVLCVRTEMKKKKWLWIIFIICGFGALTINWTTGQLVLNPLTVQLFGAGCCKPGLYGQWTISISFPLGAILFLLRRKRLMRMPKAEEAVPEERTAHMDIHSDHH